MKILLFLIAIGILPTSSKAQKHDDNWLIGQSNSGMLLNFENEAQPNITEVSQEMYFRITNANISDSLGNLLFYTNGRFISNFNHQVIENGDSINIGPFVDLNPLAGQNIQGSLILPFPSQQHKYVLFHQSFFFENGVIIPDGINYSTIDMNENNGLGRIVEKRIPIVIDSLQPGQITATKHANGRDWWVLIFEMNNNRYYRLLLTPNGVENLGSFEEGLYNHFAASNAVFSPNGEKYVRWSAPYGFPDPQEINIYDFDRCEGLLSNHERIMYADTAAAGGAAISPNNKYLYISSFYYLYQYDLEADDIEASKEVVATYDGFYDGAPIFQTSFFNPQLAPNGKIYICAPNGVSYLHVIDNPNLGGLECDVQQHSIELPQVNSFSIPNHPNFRLGPLDGSPCDTLGLNNLPVAGFTYEKDTVTENVVYFTDNSFYEPTDWLWDFDDNGVTSTEMNPLYEFSESGIYNVCLTVSNQYSSDTFCREVEIILNDASNIRIPDFSVSVFPNPIQGEFTVFTSEYLKKEAEIVFYNQLGQEVAKFSLQKGQQVHNFVLENVVDGIYFYGVFQQGVKVNEGKIVISK